jgi:DNA-binding GntR family transcriptional regulator
MLAACSDRQSQSDRAYAELVNRLTSLRIGPGSPIDEALIAADLAISRSSIREAMRRLAADRLVTTHPQRGTFASTIGITDLSCICDVRIALEGHAAQRAAERHATIDHPALRRLRCDLTRDRHSGDLQQRLELYARVHRFLYHATANPHMEETMSRYLNLSPSADLDLAANDVAFSAFGHAGQKCSAASWRRTSRSGRRALGSAPGSSCA